MNPSFQNRAEAGRLLAERLLQLRLPAPIVVLALPRGGVTVGAEVARALGAPLDVVLVRKIGAPWQPEYALAAVAEGDPPEIFVDPDLRRGNEVDMNYVNAQAQTELIEIARRRQAYLRGRAPLEVKGSTAIVVDDGIATGATMRAALKALRRREPALLVLAVPVAPQDTLLAMRGEVDQIVCLAQPYPFVAVGEHYVDFDQVSDAQVIQALASAPPARS
jgi:putative phosphoribosyl transferase